MTNAEILLSLCIHQHHLWKTSNSFNENHEQNDTCMKRATLLTIGEVSKKEIYTLPYT